MACITILPCIMNISIFGYTICIIRLFLCRYQDWQKNYQKERLEPVKELIINWYSPADDAVLPIRRYILEKDFERVKEILMNHYPDAVIYEGKSEYTMKEVEERPGYFVRKAG